MSLSYIKRAEQGNHSALSFVASITLCVGVLFLGGMPLLIAIALKSISKGEVSDVSSLKTMDRLMGHFPYHISFFLLMLGFVMLVITIWFCIRFIHRRKFVTIWSDQDMFRWKDFLIGLFISLALFVASDMVIHAIDPTYHKWVFDGSKFWIYLPFALILIPIQTLAEELLFRGHLYQAFGLATKNKWTALLLAGIIFGLFHFGNSEMNIDFWKMGIIYIGSGLMIGLSVMFSRGIEFGWGFHLINNLYLSTICTFPGSSLSGPTLFAIPKPSGDRILIEFAIQFILFALILLVVYRKNVKSLFNMNA